MERKKRKKETIMLHAQATFVQTNNSTSLENCTNMYMYIHVHVHVCACIVHTVEQDSENQGTLVPYLCMFWPLKWGCPSNKGIACTSCLKGVLVRGVVYIHIHIHVHACTCTVVYDSLFTPPPPSLSLQLSTFMVMYRTHCQRILDSVARANFAEVRQHACILHVHVQYMCMYKTSIAVQYFHWEMCGMVNSLSLDRKSVV